MPVDVPATSQIIELGPGNHQKRSTRCIRWQHQLVKERAGVVTRYMERTAPLDLLAPPPPPGVGLLSRVAGQGSPGAPHAMADLPFLAGLAAPPPHFDDGRDGSGWRGGDGRC